MTELYTRDILRLAAEVPGRVGFDEIDGAERRSRTCGARCRVAVTLDDNGRVAGLTQAVEACAFGQAAAAVMAGVAPGLDAVDAEVMRDRIAQWLGGDDGAALAEIELLAPARERPGRHGAILLPFETLAAAIAEARR